MCGRYYISEEMAEEIKKVVNSIPKADFWGLQEGREVFPTNTVPVISSQGDELAITEQKWGFPRWDNKKGVLINARAETVEERKTFKGSVQERRCIIPAAGFFEWDSGKNKIAFMDKERPVLYLAGFYKQVGDETRFMIITTAANNSIADVHDRMPLILEREELQNWVFDDTAYKFMLRKVPKILSREMVEK